MNTMLTKRIIENMGFYNVKFKILKAEVEVVAFKKETLGREEKEIKFIYSHKRLISRRILVHLLLSGILEEYEKFSGLTKEEKKEYIKKNEGTIA